MEQKLRKLPKWAQIWITQLRQENAELQTLATAHGLLQGRNWFAIEPQGDDDRIFRMVEGRPMVICQLHPDDVLLVGRKKT